MKVPFGSYEALAAQFIAALDEWVGATASCAQALGIDHDSVLWSSFSAGYYLADTVRWRGVGYPVCRPNLQAYAAGAMARVAVETP